MHPKKRREKEGENREKQKEGREERENWSKRRRKWASMVSFPGLSTIQFWMFKVTGSYMVMNNEHHQNLLWHTNHVTKGTSSRHYFTSVVMTQSAARCTLTIKYIKIVLPARSWLLSAPIRLHADWYQLWNYLCFYTHYTVVLKRLSGKITSKINLTLSP